MSNAYSNSEHIRNTQYAFVYVYASVCHTVPVPCSVVPPSHKPRRRDERLYLHCAMEDHGGTEGTEETAGHQEPRPCHSIHRETHVWYRFQPNNKPEVGLADDVRVGGGRGIGGWGLGLGLGLGGR